MQKGYSVGIDAAYEQKRLAVRTMVKNFMDGLRENRSIPFFLTEMKMRDPKLFGMLVEESRRVESPNAAAFKGMLSAVSGTQPAFGSGFPRGNGKSPGTDGISGAQAEVLKKIERITMMRGAYNIAGPERRDIDQLLKAGLVQRIGGGNYIIMTCAGAEYLTGLPKM